VAVEAAEGGGAMSEANEARFPLVRQGMIDAVQAAGHHAMAQQSLQRILQTAMEWQERNGCTCCRVPRAVDKLAHELAYVHTVAALECVTLSDGGWWKISGLEGYEKAGIERDFLYLEMRGLIERHPKKADWFKVRDESEAAIFIGSAVESRKWRVVNRFVKEEFCPEFDTEEEALRNFNRHTPNDIRIERLDTTVTVVRDVSDRRCARIDCEDAHCGEWNCNSCHPDEVRR
jgi:hypothetical protein